MTSTRLRASRVRRTGEAGLSTKRARGGVAVLAVVAAVATVLLVPTLGPGAAGDTARPAPGSAAAAAAQRRPSVVLVVLDDFSMDLLRTMRSARTMRERGASYRHSYVVDSLCCVSRASTFTGQYPHQTGVRTNVSETGDADRPRRRLAGLPALRQPRPLGQRAPAGRGLHHRLRRQVPQRVRVQARRTGPAPPARLGRPPRRLRLGLRRLGLLHLAGRRPAGSSSTTPPRRPPRRARPSRTRRTPAP